MLASAEEGLLTRVIFERSDGASRDMLAVLTVEPLPQHEPYATEPESEQHGELSLCPRLRLVAGTNDVTAHPVRQFSYYAPTSVAQELRQPSHTAHLGTHHGGLAWWHRTQDR
jgi:hypothetical protein